MHRGIPPPLRDTLLELVCGNLSPTDFETWLGPHLPELQAALDPDAFLSLLEGNLSTPEGADATRAAAYRVLTASDPDCVVRYQVELLLRNLLAGRLSPLLTVRRVAQFLYAGHDFIPAAFRALESELEHVPTPEQYVLYSPQLLSDHLQLLEAAIPAILAESRSLLTVLERERLAVGAA